MVKYKTIDIIEVYNNLKSCYESLAYCIATSNFKLVYHYLGVYCDLYYSNYDLINLNLINFQDILIFDNFNIVGDIENLRKEI